MCHVVGRNKVITHTRVTEPKETFHLLYRISQVELKQQIEGLAEELKKISDAQPCPLDLDIYVRKLMNAKLKVTVVSNILQTAQDRLNKVHFAIEKEAARRRALLEPSPITTPAAESSSASSVQ